MNKIMSILITVLVLSFSGYAHAILLDRGGGMIYDSDQDLTWLQDASYSKTSGFDADGRMDWATAVSWADGLVFGGYDDWRLPTVIDNGNDGCNHSFNGTDCGYNVDPSSSEMAYMHFNNLGNISFFDTSGNLGGCSFSEPQCLVNTGPFVNILTREYWSGTEYSPDTANLAWVFGIGSGGQGFSEKVNTFSAWAVRAGDVTAGFGGAGTGSSGSGAVSAPAPVPEPGTIILPGSGLIGLVGYNYKRNKKKI